MMIRLFDIYSSRYIQPRKRMFCLGILLLAVVLVILSTTDAFADYSLDEYKKYCSSAKFEEKYKTDCWSCDTVKQLMSAMMSVIVALSGPINNLSHIILILGAAIWIALYFLKSVSSFAMQDPAKIIDGVLVFMFKWALAFLVVNSGVVNIVDMIVNPLLSIGMEIGETFTG